jgi:hypothetical protein
MLILCVVHHPPLLYESVEAKVLTPVSFKTTLIASLPNHTVCIKMKAVVAVAAVVAQ